MCRALQQWWNSANANKGYCIASAFNNEMLHTVLGVSLKKIKEAAVPNAPKNVLCNLHIAALGEHEEVHSKSRRDQGTATNAVASKSQTSAKIMHGSW